MSKRLVFIAVLMCLCLSACNREKPVETNYWGEPITETEATEATTEEDDSRFAVEEGFWVYNPEGTIAAENPVEEPAEEKAITEEIESREAESEAYVYTDLVGVEEDIREEAGYKGLLKNITTKGGIDFILEYYDRAELEESWDLYIYATEEEKDKLLDIIYSGTAEEKTALEEEVLHTEVGWYQDDAGTWKNVYDGPKWDLE